MGRKGLKFSRPSACRADSRWVARSLLEGEAEALWEGPNAPAAAPSEPLLYRDTVLEDLDTGWEDG